MIQTTHIIAYREPRDYCAEFITSGEGTESMKMDLASTCGTSLECNHTNTLIDYSSLSSPTLNADQGSMAFTKVNTDITAGRAAKILFKDSLEIEKLWEFNVGSHAWGTPVIGSDGTVYACGEEGKLYAIKDGIKLWEYDTCGNVTDGPSLGPDGTIYIGNWSNKLVAVKDGKKLWEFQAGNYVATTPAVGKDGTIYFGDDNGYIFAVKDGKEIWKFNAGGIMKAIRSSPVVDDDSTVYFGSFNNHVFAVKDGKEIWRFDTKNLIKDAPALAPDGTLYVGSDIGKLFALDKKNGTVKWDFSARGFETKPCLGSDGIVYLGCNDSSLKAVKDGVEQWSVSGLANWTVNSPALAPEGIVIAGTDRNTLCFLQNGKLIKEITLPDEVKSMPAVGKDGKVYVSCMNGKVYAYQLPCAVEAVHELLEGKEIQLGGKPEIVDEDEWILIDNLKLPKRQ